MNNTEILKKKWVTVDNELSSFLNTYKKINKKTQDNIQTIFDSYEFTKDNINKYANNTIISRFKRVLEEIIEEYDESDYYSYMARKYLKKGNIRNREILEFLIYTEYSKEKLKMDEYESIMFKKISEDAYSYAIKECEKIKPKPKRKLSWFDSHLIAILLLPNAKGDVWKDYKDGITEYNAKEIYKLAFVDINRDVKPDISKPQYQKTIISQQKRYINKKKESDVDKYSGALDDQVASVYNQVVVRAYQDFGIEEVKFVATIDGKQTKMCNSLNNQVFKLNDYNTYSRWSEIDGKDVVYTTYGVEIGENLPPINNHFHYCRSSVIPTK